MGLEKILNPTSPCSNEDFIKLWNTLGSPALVAKKLGVSTRRVMTRRRDLETKYSITLETWNDTSDRRVVLRHEDGRLDLPIRDGVVIVFSDAHYWPGVRTTMHRALLAMIRQLKPVVVICNGDAFDGGQISRYPRIGWDKKPTVAEELEAVTERLLEVSTAAGGAHLVWPLGNHDARYETKLAASAPEFEHIKGFKLRDHFPEWRSCWTCWLNGNTVVTHFYHSGIHATHNNLLKGQCNYVTGHTHSLQTRPWTNAMGKTLWAVDTGTLAESLAAHNADYQQGRHGNHRSGFAVLTFRGGELLMPEIAVKWDEDSFVFRGHVLDADTAKIL